MRRPLWLCLLLAMLTICVASHALATLGADENRKYFAFAGLYMPSSSSFSDQSGSLWKSGGFGLGLNLDEYGRPDATIALEYIADKQDYFSASRTSLTYMRYFRQPVTDEAVRGFYYGLGSNISYGKMEVKAQPYVMPPIVAKESSGFLYGATLVGGYDLNENLYGEIRYTYTNRLDGDADFSGLSLIVGTRSLF